MNTTSTAVEGDGLIHFMLLPIFVIAFVIGFSAAGVLYISKKRSYDPLEADETEREVLLRSESAWTEREVLLRSESAEVTQGWIGFYQNRHPLLVKSDSA